ncbi:hypothetical protein HanRHA438_Chr13g0604721 [Helianthus annuus]|nr:hypothetical protein HanIR_Chr13g0646301 [Helianthus annuus]KAJ0858755.1 hypothetical protein HanRHA438_Chr13g0604721 [Helianthus annuus]
MCTENVQELRTFGEELVDEGQRIRQIGERLVWKYDERNMQYWMNPINNNNNNNKIYICVA